MPPLPLVPSTGAVLISLLHNAAEALLPVAANEVGKWLSGKRRQHEVEVGISMRPPTFIVQQAPPPVEHVQAYQQQQQAQPVQQPQPREQPAQTRAPEVLFKQEPWA